MKVFSFTCTECALAIDSPFYLEGSARAWGHTAGGAPEKIDAAECGPLKRNWSGSFVWPQSARGH